MSRRAMSNKKMQETGKQEEAGRSDLHRCNYSYNVFVISVDYIRS